LTDLIGYLAPKIDYDLIDLMASTTSDEKKLESALINLLDIDVLAQLITASYPRLSTLTDNLSSIYRQHSLAAIL
jgi:hypothetical protein